MNLRAKFFYFNFCTSGGKMLINPLNLIQIKNNSNPPLKTKSDFAGNFNNSKLKPLNCDKVSFTSNASLNRALMNAYNNKAVCEEVYKNAAVAHNALKKLLNKSLLPFVANKQNPHGMIAKIVTRIKTPDSIREKAAGELEETINRSEMAFNPNFPENIKQVCRDIVGARIVLRKAEPKQMSEMIDVLIEEVRKRNLKIISIENNRSDKIDKKYEYVSQDDLKRLVDAVNEMRGEGEAPVTVQNINTKSGYMALHLNIDLSNPNYKAKNTGYFGEIQIVGEDVERLKDVEDFCYKIKLGKDIKGGDPSYRPFVEYFSNYMNDNARYPNLRDDFRKYTLSAYIRQRMKKPKHLDDKTKKDFSLPSIKDCNMVKQIPPGLDFNVLANIKYHCDKIHDMTSKYKK